jgi:Zn-dependent peptidase ImmA (M78 family)
MQNILKNKTRKKINLDNLYNLAFEKHIPVDETCPASIISMSICLSNGKKIISLSNEKEDDSNKEYTKLECFAHEMGHCMTDSFYEGYSPYELRAKHEHRANKWAVNYVIPFPELCQAVKDGHREIWDLAEYFDVSCSFVEKAINIHSQNGNVVPTEFYAE